MPEHPPTSDRSRGSTGPAFSRRSFLGGALWLVAAPPLCALGCGGKAATPAPVLVDGWEIPLGTVLPPTRFAQLAALFDALIPADDETGFPGAAGCHAAWYLDQLLGAFRTDPPRIYAGGPYSGRHGGVDGFDDFQPLTRVEELRWRTYLEGSRRLPEREWNGPVQGLVDRYPEGLEAFDRRAREKYGAAFTALDGGQRRGLLFDADPAFLALAYEHAVEGTYGDPVYGGNFEARGWAAIAFEGDRQPLGYTARQMSHPEEG